MIKKVSFFLLVLASYSSFGQNTRFEVNTKTGFMYYAQDNAEANDAKIEGSKYIDDKFRLSKVSGVAEITPLMRYNAYRDEMEFVEGGKAYFVSKADSLEIKLLEKSYQYRNYQLDKGRNEGGYLVVLVKDPKISLFKKEKVVLVPEYVPSSPHLESKPAYYKREDDRFFITVSNTIVLMPKKKKDFLALFPNQAAAIEGYLKQNKVSFDNESNLIDLVKFMNTL